MVDIVTRLQAHNHVGQCAGCLHCEAAAEIERLRAFVALVRSFCEDDGAGDEDLSPIDRKYNAVVDALATLTEGGPPWLTSSTK